MNEETLEKLRAIMEDALRDATRDETVDDLIEAALGRIEWVGVGEVIIDDVFSEENTDALILAFQPEIESLVEKALGRMSFLARLVPFLDIPARVTGALDDMLPEVIADPLKRALRGEELAV